MSDTQLLRQMVNERLAAAAEEIFGMVEQTIADYQQQVFSSRSEIVRLKQIIEQLGVLKPEVKLLRSDDPESDTEQTGSALEESDTPNPEQIKVEQEELGIGQDLDADCYEDYQAPVSETEPEEIRQNDWQPLPGSSEITLTYRDEEDWNEIDSSSSSVSYPSYSEITISENKAIEKDDKKDGQSDRSRTCRICLAHFRTNVDLRKHMHKMHSGQKAFKCNQCDKVFVQKHGLVQHVRVHTGEKPYSCDFCGKTFTQNSNRIVHMRQHTGEKPYFCINCDKSFSSSNHLRWCATKQIKEKKKLFRCMTCGRTFNTEPDLNLHMEVHESWKRHLTENQQKPV